MVLSIPASLDELTPAWLTGALRAGGSLTEETVTGVTIERLGEGAGFIGQVGRLTLTYDRAATRGPRTLIAKLPSLDEGGRTIAALYGLYEREVRFYRELAADVPFRTPLCYYNDMDVPAVRYVLLLEDLAGEGRLGDQVAGCSVADAEAAMRSLAVFHAWSWEHPRLQEISWLQAGIDLVEGAMTHVYAAAWPRTVALFGDEMSAAIRDALPTLGERGMSLMDRYRDGPFTIVHGDYRADNLFFPNEAGGALAVVDWQSPNKSFGSYDVGYFLAGSVESDVLRTHGERLLRGYHETLGAGGVRDYPYGRFYEDYVGSLLAYLVIFVINGATLETSNERGAELFRLIYRRLAAAITDTDALSLL